MHRRRLTRSASDLAANDQPVLGDLDGGEGRGGRFIKDLQTADELLPGAGENPVDRDVHIIRQRVVPRRLDRILERLVQEIERQIRVHGGIAVGLQRHLLGRGIERELEFLGELEGHVGAGPHHELETRRELDLAGLPFERGTGLALKREFDGLLQGNAQDRHLDGDFLLEVADRLGHRVKQRLQQVLDIFLAGGEREAAESAKFSSSCRMRPVGNVSPTPGSAGRRPGSRRCR